MINKILPIAWTYVINPFCAVTSVCSILMNNDLIINYISPLNDVFSIFIKDSLKDPYKAFDVPCIPQVLWDSDPILILSRIYGEYSSIKNFCLFNIIANIEIETDIYQFSA